MSSEAVQRIKVHELRSNLHDLVRRVMVTGRPLVLTCYGKDIVQIVPMNGGPFEPDMRERYPELFAR